MTGAVALVLHGVPRVTADVDLAADAEPKNLARLERLLASWGYGEGQTASGGDAIRRFRHPSAAIGEIDIVPLAPGEYRQARDRAAAVTLVDVEIPVAASSDLRKAKLRAGGEDARADAAALTLLAAIRAGEAVGNADDADTRATQIRKFSRWSVAARLDWLLAAARLKKGLAPEARPLTRGLTRRHGWYGRR